MLIMSINTFGNTCTSGKSRTNNRGEWNEW